MEKSHVYGAFTPMHAVECCDHFTDACIYYLSMNSLPHFFMFVNRKNIKNRKNLKKNILFKGDGETKCRDFPVFVRELIIYYRIISDLNSRPDDRGRSSLHVTPAPPLRRRSFFCGTLCRICTRARNPRARARGCTPSHRSAIAPALPPPPGPRRPCRCA